MTDHPSLARVLVVDDQPDVRSMIGAVLKSAGYSMVPADTASTAIAEFETTPFDLAIVDLFMPGLDGAKLIKILREREPNLPIIAISGVTMRSSGRNALDLVTTSTHFANVHCLQKPFRSAQLVNTIRTALAEAA